MRHSHVTPLRLRLTVTLAVLAGCGGCAGTTHLGSSTERTPDGDTPPAPGSATVLLIPLNTRTLAPDTPLEYRFQTNQCYWWIDDDDRVNLALRFDKRAAPGDLTDDILEISFVLDELPAGSGREYKSSRHTARGLWHRSALHLRLRSLTGIVVLDVTSGERLVGQFRLNCSSRKFEVLAGWKRQTSALVQGSFTAVRDPAAGPAIRERTEAGQPREQPPAADD